MKKKETQDPKYHRDELVAHSVSLFGVQPEVIAGALHDSDQTDFTIDEMRDMIDQFLMRKVK